MKQFSSTAKRRSVISIVLVVALMTMLCATTAYAVSNGSYTWHQSLGNWVSAEFDLDADDRVVFEGVATSPGYGTFRAELQSQGWFGIWGKVGGSYTYTVEQFAYQTFNTRTWRDVNGNYFKCYWPAFGSGKYRVVLYGATNPQETVLTGVYFPQT